MTATMAHAMPARSEKHWLRWALKQSQWDVLTEHLSGGQKKLIMLAKLLVQEPQLLLLDEPDNHLDLEAKDNLEKIIRGYNGCVVIISHDRYLTG